MRVLALVFLLTLLPYRAFAASLEVRSLSIDHEKQQIAFDVVNTSKKPIHAWFVSIVSHKRIAGAPAESPDRKAAMLMPMQTCAGARPAPPLLPGESRHCDASAYSGEPSTLLDAEVVITAVLFEDGSTEGDAGLVDNFNNGQRASLRTFEFWLAQLEPALSAATPREQLQQMQKVLSQPDSALPENMRYDPVSDREHRQLLEQINYVLQRFDTILHPELQALSTIYLLKQNIDALRASILPARSADAAPPLPSDPLDGWTTISRTNALRLSAVRSSDVGSTLFLNNITTKTITAGSVGIGNPNPRGERSQGFDCFPDNGCGVAPGASYAMLVAMVRERVAVIRAVVFDDGTGEGLQTDIDRILFTRLGRVFETERIRALLDAPGADLESLPAKIGDLPQSPEHAMAAVESVRVPGVTLDRVRAADGSSQGAFYGGVRNAREDAGRRVSQAHNIDEFRREIRDLSDQYRAYCQRIYAAKP